MAPEAAKYLWDAQAAALRIQRFIQGKTFDDYLADELLRSGVERQFEIIGEALGQLRKHFPEVAAQIAELPRVVGFRNVLIHGYATVDDTLVWGTIDKHLAPMLLVLRNLLTD